MAGNKTKTGRKPSLYRSTLATALLAEIKRLDALRNIAFQQWLEAGKPARQEGQPHEWEQVEARRRQVWTAFQYYTEHEKAPSPE